MADLFSAYEVQDPGATLHAYLFESTAPDNIDDPVNTPDVPRKTVKISAAEAVEKIASALKTSLKTSINPPSLIISIHGFNNPRDVILKGYWNSFSFVNKDNAIHNRDAVCIGYRWPSERIGAPFLTAYQAAPTFLRGLLLVGCVPIGITLFFAPFRQATRSNHFYYWHICRGNRPLPIPFARGCVLSGWIPGDLFRHSRLGKFNPADRQTFSTKRRR
jgi:hypothetical protein